MSTAATVEITQSGRGGSITYREGPHEIGFSWEFATGDTIALVFGPPGAGFDAAHPWAAGRRAEIFDAVGEAVVEQRAPSHRPDVDLDTGIIAIVRNTPDAPPRRVARPAAPSQELVAAPTVAALRTLLEDRLSVEARLAAAEELHRLGQLDDLEARLCRDLRALHRPDDGLHRALRLARADPTAAVRQALLWASWNRTPCAPACAALLLDLAGHTASPDDPIVAGLSDHANFFERDAAFTALCTLIGEELDPDRG